MNTQYEKARKIREADIAAADRSNPEDGAAVLGGTEAIEKEKRPSGFAISSVIRCGGFFGC